MARTADVGVSALAGIVHVRPEQLITMNRNDRSRSSEIVGHDDPALPPFAAGGLDFSDAGFKLR